MKPPWKYLSQLVSRKPTAETPEQPIARTSDSKLIEIEAQATPVPFLASPEAVPARDDSDRPSADHAKSLGTGQSESDADPLSLVGSAVYIDEIKPEANDDDREPNVEVTLSSPAGEAPVKSPRNPRKTLRKAGRNVGDEATAPSLVLQAEKPVSKPTQPADPFVQEATNLDDEIKHLRAQLAEKLQTQNAQLRKMLERFKRF